jgi:hypothetical protein
MGKGKWVDLQTDRTSSKKTVKHKYNQETLGNGVLSHSQSITVHIISLPIFCTRNREICISMVTMHEQLCPSQTYYLFLDFSLIKKERKRC